MVNWANTIHHLFHSIKRKGREAHHIESGKILEPLGISKKDEK